MRLSSPTLLGARSIATSLIIAAALGALYYLDLEGSYVNRRLTDGLFFGAIAALFYVSKRFSDRVLLLALLTAFCEGWATFAKEYRAAFYGSLFLMAAIWNLWKALLGIVGSA